jgi:hypothetical protein
MAHKIDSLPNDAATLKKLLVAHTRRLFRDAT